MHKKGGCLLPCMQDINIAPSSIECLVTPSRPSERHLFILKPLHCCKAQKTSCVNQKKAIGSALRFDVASMPCFYTLLPKN